MSYPRNHDLFDARREYLQTLLGMSVWCELCGFREVANLWAARAMLVSMAIHGRAL